MKPLESERSLGPLSFRNPIVPNAGNSKELSPKPKAKVRKIHAFMHSNSTKKAQIIRTSSNDEAKNDMDPAKTSDNSYDILIDEFKQTISNKKAKNNNLTSTIPTSRNMPKDQILHSSTNNTTQSRKKSLLIIPSHMIKKPLNIASSSKNLKISPEKIHCNQPSTTKNIDQRLELPDDSNFAKMVSFIEEIKSDLNTKRKLQSPEPCAKFDDITPVIVHKVSASIGDPPEILFEKPHFRKKAIRNPVQPKQTVNKSSKFEALKNVISKKTQSKKTIAKKSKPVLIQDNFCPDLTNPKESQEIFLDMEKMRTELNIQEGEAMNLFPKLKIIGFENVLKLSCNGVKFCEKDILPKFEVFTLD